MQGLKLIQPETYKGYCAHPTADNTRRPVIEAMIKRSYRSGGYDLEIFFTEGKSFYRWSPSVRGAKQCFAFQCRAGSKWEEIA